jgi:hypothetical protein
MYGSIWRRLPGSTAARTALAVVLVVGVGFLLWYLVYPWASGHLPVDQIGFG